MVLFGRHYFSLARGWSWRPPNFRLMTIFVQVDRSFSGWGHNILA